MITEKETIEKILRARGVIASDGTFDAIRFNKLVTEPWIHQKAKQYGFIDGAAKAEDPNTDEPIKEIPLEPTVEIETPKVEITTEVSEKINEAIGEAPIDETKEPETPVSEEPAAEEPADETPVEEAKVEEPAAEEPADETPVEEAKAEEPAAEEPVVEEEKPAKKATKKTSKK